MLGRATVTGELDPDPEETRGAAWYTPAQVRALAECTLAHARGEFDDEEFALAPGVEPVWLELLHAAGVLSLSAHDRDLARRLYATPPRDYWLDGRLVPAEQVARDRVSA